LSNIQLAILSIALASPAIFAETLTVGPQGRYAKPCQALSVAKDGDTINIDAAGSYDGDVCVFRASNLLIRGVNGRPRIDAAGANAQGKGIWVVSGNNNIVENVEMSGARVNDRNGACIRLEGIGLTLRRVYFHDNEEGLLTNGRNGDILIEYSEFDRNGDGLGYAHNIYVNNERRLIVRYSYFHRSLVGNVIKSRATNNFFYHNTFASEDAPSSWEVDIPNGGTAILVGNIIQQGPLSGNGNIISYMLEGPVAGRTNVLHLAHNTVVNEGPGEFEGTPPYFLVPAKTGYSGLILNNIFAGPGLLMPELTRDNFEIRDNLTGEDPRFVAPSLGDYRLQDTSPAAGKAGPIPTGLADLLTPLAQIQPPACAQLRPSAYPASLGAFELGTAEANLSAPCSLSSPLDFAWIYPSVSTLTSSLSQLARVQIAGVASENGVSVRLIYSHPSLVSGPSDVTIPAGESSALVTLNCTAPSAPTFVTLTAVLGERSQDSLLYFNIPVVVVPAISRITLSPASLTGGSTSTGNFIQLNTSAPRGGLSVSLSSSHPSLATVPAAVVIPEGRSQASFTLTTREASSPTQVSITASQGPNTLTAALLLSPAALSRIDLPARTLGSPGVYRGRLFLTGPAPAAGLTVQLSSSAPEALVLPPNVAVPAGASSAPFEIRTNSVSAPVSGELRASLAGVARSVPFTVDALSLAAVQLSPSTLTGGLTSGNHRVVLNSPAFEGTPLVISLSSSNPGLASVPAQVTIQPGQSSAPFQIVTTPVSGLSEVEITAQATQPFAGVSSRSATLTLRSQ
jgi:hypothetical protein